MKQLELFQMTKAAQSLSIAAKANGKQSNLSSNFTASENFFFAPIGAKDDDVDFGDIYDEYIDFDVCSRVW